MALDVSASKMPQNQRSSLLPLIVDSGLEMMALTQVHPLVTPASWDDGLKTLETSQGKHHSFRNCQNPSLLRLLI